MNVWPGSPSPPGATPDGDGTNFSLWSRAATRVELCLFDEDGTETRVDLPASTDHRWHGYVPDVGPGQRYGYRVHGPYQPRDGHRCNPHKLLLDPYARAVDGEVVWHDAIHGYPADEGFDAARGDRPDETDSAPWMAKGVVVDDGFDWGDDIRPDVPLTESVIYEVHVKGFTAAHPDVRPELRGTFAGMASPAAIAHLKELGVTAVELLPVNLALPERDLVERGLTNYWGYNPISWFAFDPRLAAADTPQGVLDEFKGMVKLLHQAGIEVLLDVVFNHTGEGSHLGPTVSLRGIDNWSYYRLSADDRRFCANYSGCGNTVELRTPQTVQLVCDALRWLVTECHVDGFRFDLATTLARDTEGFDPEGLFLTVVGQDPVLRDVKLIAEPWDVGPGGYQLGGFPPPWSEWNDRFRDTIRDYWRGVDESLPELAARLAGSQDRFAHNGRQPVASINLVTSHDGFTLRDLVSYNERHNEANGYDNTDGHSHERSWNCGVEGPTDDPQVNALRSRQQRNLLATLLLSQGVPMLLGGDEMGRSQGGNNNAYCQDNEISWFDWGNGDDDGGPDEDLLDFSRQLIAFRKAHPVLRRRRWFEGRSIRGTKLDDIGWFRPDGEEMDDDDWDVGHARSLAVFLNGRGIDTPGPQGEPIVDDDLMVIFNAAPDTVPFDLPSALGDGWTVVVDTAGEGWLTDPPAAPETLDVEGRSLVILLRSAATTTR